MTFDSESVAPGAHAPRPQLVAADDLGPALRALGDLPPRDLVVEVDAPARSPLREFLRQRARPSGGWLNRGWALSLADVPALARVAESCGPLPARLFRHDAEGPAIPVAREPRNGEARLWVTLDHDRRRPPATGGTT